MSYKLKFLSAYDKNNKPNEYEMKFSSIKLMGQWLRRNPKIKSYQRFYNNQQFIITKTKVLNLTTAAMMVQELHKPLEINYFK